MSDEWECGAVVQRRDCAKRYRSELDGDGFKVVILSDKMTGLPARVPLKGGFTDFRKHLSRIVPDIESATTNMPRCVGPYDHPADRRAFLDHAQEAFDRVWRTFSPTAPCVSVSYVTRSAVAGLFYIVLDGATIAYNRSTATYQIDDQTEKGWIGEGFTYISPNAGGLCSNTALHTAAGFEAFLSGAGISMGDFVEVMLDAMENPLWGGIAQTFTEHYLPIVHARYTAFLGRMNMVVLNVGTVRLNITFRAADNETSVRCIGNPMPWMTEAVLEDDIFWKKLAVRVLGKAPVLDTTHFNVVAWRKTNGPLDGATRFISDVDPTQLGPPLNTFDESVPASQEY